MNKLTHSDALLLLSKLELLLVSKAEIQSVTMGSRGKMDSMVTMEFAGAIAYARKELSKKRTKQNASV